jgi:hypothetical protein
MKPIIEWKGKSSCMAQFSFDENSIYTVDQGGEVTTTFFRMRKKERKKKTHLSL